MQAAPNSVVRITYQLRTEPNGAIVDEATVDAPFSFLFGHGNVLPKFEEYLGGKVAGNQFSFVLSPEEGYGVYEDEGVVQLGKDAFMWEGKIQEDLLVLGNIVPLQDNQGNMLQGRIVDIQEEAVVLDLNHPLAGEELHFSGQVIEVREAHPVEIEHGHVHEGGNHHHH
ncbi:MAG: peptidylprolyl isomerase [Chitinophagales bacterium]|nr:peptidylprolyl isomerase [Chitinophagales bacterium]